jgi:hypothetical protein
MIIPMFQKPSILPQTVPQDNKDRTDGFHLFPGDEHFKLSITQKEMHPDRY